MTQKEALDILKTGVNVFVTGPAGSGKTYLVNEYIKYLKDHDVPIGITASTGIAATHMGGMTIHSWSGIGVKDFISKSDIEELVAKDKFKKRIQETKVLIIDEVSMLHHFRLDMIEKVLREASGKEAPFGGIQVVLCGDFFQLPPVSRLGEPLARFIYHSEAWKKGMFKVCYLSQNFRQGDDPAISILNEIRSGDVSETARQLLGTRFKTSEGGEVVVNMGEEENDDIKTRLYTHNMDVDRINDLELSKLAEIEITHEMTHRGRKPLILALQKSCLAPEKLKLKKGAKVMCVKNNFEEGYVNGTLGVVVNCAYDMDPIIKTANGKRLTITKASWKIEEDGKVLAEIEQYPLRLAWAITVHKSQGMSLDAVEVDLSKSFEPGMGYVALSRARTLAGLSLLGLNAKALQVHPEVLEYDGHLQKQSEEIQNIFAVEDRLEIEKRQAEFLARVAPLHSLKKTKTKKEKSPKVSTLDKTAELIRDKKTLKEIASARNMVVETIINHLEELAKEDMVSYISNPPDNKKLDISYFRYDISPQHWQKIEEALEKVSLNSGDDKPPLLSPVKNLLGPNVSFKEIRLARVLLGYFRKDII